MRRSMIPILVVGMTLPCGARGQVETDSGPNRGAAASIRVEMTPDGVRIPLTPGAKLAGDRGPAGDHSADGGNLAPEGTRILLT